MIAIIDYGAGNIRSIQNSLKRLNCEAVLSHDAEEISGATKVIFPGVGAAGAAMERLKATGLDELIPKLRQPVLGICLGMQLMCTWSEENDTPGLGIFPQKVLKFPSTGKVPHLGWNACRDLKGPLFEQTQEGTDFYFVHSYFASPGPETSSICDYLIPFSASLQKGNFYGVQFHPEKSGPMGQQLLNQFLQI